MLVAILIVAQFAPVAFIIWKVWRVLGWKEFPTWRSAAEIAAAILFSIIAEGIRVNL